MQVLFFNKLHQYNMILLEMKDVRIIHRPGIHFFQCSQESIFSFTRAKHFSHGHGFIKAYFITINTHRATEMIAACLTHPPSSPQGQN
jgi:hypothetical protein